MTLEEKQKPVNAKVLTRDYKAFSLCNYKMFCSLLKLNYTQVFSVIIYKAQTLLLTTNIFK